MQRPASSARPLETKRLQRLSRKSRSHRSKRDRRTSSHFESSASDDRRAPRAAPASSTRARAHPALSSQRSGQRQRPSGGDLLGLNPGKRGTRLAHDVALLGRGRLRLSSDSDSGSGSESEQEKKVQTNRWAAVSDSDSSDEGERVVRSAKDKAWDGMKAVVSEDQQRAEDQRLARDADAWIS